MRHIRHQQSFSIQGFLEHMRHLFLKIPEFSTTKLRPCTYFLFQNTLLDLRLPRVPILEPVHCTHFWIGKKKHSHSHPTILILLQGACCTRAAASSAAPWHCPWPPSSPTSARRAPRPGRRRAATAAGSSGTTAASATAGLKGPQRGLQRAETCKNSGKWWKTWEKVKSGEKMLEKWSNILEQVRS